ncbi:MAG: hypothetical protein K2R98_23370 [Gemmataceae bacterium]|nr:hypothetical protein [Gemmataceae bacterium]
MGRLLFWLFILLLIGVGVGFALGWFSIALSGDNKGFRVNFFVDKEKIEKDEEKAKKQLEKTGDKIKEKTSN